MKINSFYLLSFSVILFLGSIVLLNKSEKNLTLINTNLVASKVLAENFASLRDNWSVKNSIKRVDKIISNIKRSRKNLNITIKPKQNIKLIIVKSDSVSDLDYFLNKILNSNTIINKISISRDKISLEVAR
jgi:septation ring formation regulator EzrA